MGLGNAMKCRAIIYDYIGTLVNCRGYNMAVILRTPSKPPLQRGL
jgi:hypothetical protein